MSQTVATHIELRPNRSGQLRAYIEGTRVRVQDIYGYAILQGYPPEQIAQELPHLTLGQVYAALSYYHDHRDEILQELREADEVVGELRKQAGPSPLEERLKQHMAAKGYGA